MMEIVEVSEDEGNNESPDNTSFIPSAGPTALMSKMELSKPVWICSH